MHRETLADRFETERPRLHAVAWRLLGSSAEADDAVQEAWLRLDRAGAAGIDNLSGWLTTVVGRICLDMLRSRKSRGEEPVEEGAPESGDEEPTPEDAALLTESTAEALAVVVDTLAPAERVAFVLHDIFEVPFEDIAPIVDRTPTATRQIASRARKRVRGGGGSGRAGEVTPQRHVVEAFFRASRAGDFGALLAVLDPDVTLRLDQTALRMGSRSGWVTGDLRGATAVAEQFNGRAQAAQVVLLNGQPGGIWPNAKGAPIVAFHFTVRDGKVTEIRLAADPDHLQALNVEALGGE
ncbi:MAG: sigma-70 family RNA polymerase sigma factor [Chloroflexota bacterium]|nr:sigma-70 family RNA polymerase sigma factor [Chloroflexota bacterium]